MNSNNTDEQRTAWAARTIELRKEQKILIARWSQIKEEAYSDIDIQGEIMKSCVFSGLLLLSWIAVTAITISHSVVASHICSFITGYQLCVLVSYCKNFLEIEKARKKYEKEFGTIGARLKAIALELRSA